MAFKLIIDSLDDVDEDSRRLYVEKDGKFVLDVEGLDDVSKLSKDLRSTRAEAAAKRKQLETWEKLGKTPEEIQELMAQYEKDQEDKLRTAGQWDALKAQMNDKHAKELKAKDDLLASRETELNNMKRSLERHLSEAQATAAIAKHKGVPTLLLPHVLKHVKVEEQDGNYSIKVVDDKGDPKVDAKGNPLSVEEFVGELRSNEVFSRAFDGNGQSGGGSPPGGDGGNVPRNAKKSDFKTERERAAFVDAHGLEAYQKLPA